MTQNTHNEINVEALGEALQIIADFYKFPDEEFHRQLTTGVIHSRLKLLLEQAHFSFRDLGERPIDQLPPLAQYKQEYMRTMMAGHGRAALPIESIYKIWTTDKSANLNIAQQKGYLMGDSAIHISHLLKTLGLEIPAEFKNMPDHLTILIELLAFLLVNYSGEEVHTFITEHFDWLKDFKAKLEEIGALSIFIEITSWLISIIEQLELLLAKKKQYR